MPIETKKRFTIDEYYRMEEVGIIGPEERVELIDGEIITMTPISHRHAITVNLSAKAFIDAFSGRAVVSIQNPLRLNEYTEPEPDVVLLKFRDDDYRGKEVTSDDVLLVLEVSNTSFDYDRNIKLPRYAAAGIPEVWIAKLESDELLVYRDLTSGRYTTCLTLHRSDAVSISIFPETLFKINDLLA